LDKVEGPIEGFKREGAFWELEERLIQDRSFFMRKIELAERMAGEWFSLSNLKHLGICGRSEGMPNDLERQCC